MGLVLTGGGARGAYQAGVLKAIGEIAEEASVSIPIFSGLSAGAINATYCAAGAHDLVATTRQLVEVWQQLTPERVYRSDVVSLGKISMGWIADLSFGAFYRGGLAHSLLDHSPLRSLLAEHLDFSRIQKNIDEGNLTAVACSAFDYDQSTTVTFMQNDGSVEPWLRMRRRSEFAPLSVDHIMASASIPVLFPPTKVGDRYFGDGALRNLAPISPAVHMGCDRMIIIGVRYMSGKTQVENGGQIPSMGRILGLMLNSLFFDSTDSDVERLGHVNEILRTIPNGLMESTSYRPVDYVWIRPSVDLGKLAVETAKSLPLSIRYLMGGLGSRKESAELASYLLFDKDYTKKLVEIGYHDGLQHREGLRKFLSAIPWS